MKLILERIELGEMKFWNFIVLDGIEIKGMMCLLFLFDLNKKYFLIVYYYGGMIFIEWGISNLYCVQLFVLCDYVVYVIQLSGIIGFGQEFLVCYVNVWGKCIVDDIIEGIKQFCKEYLFVNDKKIGCFGVFYGGFMI